MRNIGEGFARDLRYVLRSLARAPVFVAGVTITFALAIGTNAAMFGLVTRLMLESPPGIRDAEHVAHVQIERSSEDGQAYVMSTTSYVTFEALRGARAFASVVGESSALTAVGRGAEIEEASILQVTGDYFKVLGVSPEAGRMIALSDDELPIGNTVVVLSYAYWKRHYASNRAIVGQELVINGTPFKIVGVAPRGFNGTGANTVDLFIPFTTAQRDKSFGWWMVAGYNIISIVARVNDDTSFPLAAQRAANAIAHSGKTADDAHSRVLLDPVVPGASVRETPQGKITLWLSGVSLVVLLIATANVSTLLLLRAVRRKRDTAVRIALGASHAQLGRHLLMESVALSVLGATVGLILSRWLSGLIRATLLPQLAPTDGLIDSGVLLLTIAVSLLAGVLSGLAPVTQVNRRSLTDDLRSVDGHRSGKFSLQSGLVTLQVAMCTMLLVGAGLFVRSLDRVQAQDLGFSTKGLLYVSLDFQGSVNGNDKTQAYSDLLDRVRSVRGVTRASLVQAMPFGNFHVPPISIPGSPDVMAPGMQPPFLYAATPEFLSMMHIVLKSGRLINNNDTRLSPKVLVVNEALANFSWPGQSPIGKCVRIGYGVSLSEGENGNPAESAPCREVVGVVKNIRARLLRADVAEERLTQYYVPFEQVPEPPIPNQTRINGMLVQVNGDPTTFVGAVQRTIQLASTIPVFARVRPYEDLMEPQLRSWRLGATLFSVFGLLALGIAAVGLFGVVSNVATQRMRELGVRRALGAPQFEIWRQVVSRALRTVMLGIAVGAAASMLASPLVRNMLYRTSPWEPANMVVVIVVLLAVTIVAAFWPAWRASKVDPLIALTSEG